MIKSFVKKTVSFLGILTLVQTQGIFSQENKELSINGFMPPQIFVSTQTQAFLTGHQFTIYNGRIWSKEDGQTQWSLFLGTGLPFFPRGERLSGHEWFETPKEIVEIAADGDTIFAFDSENHMYRCYTQTATVDKPFEWHDDFGWPKRIQLIKDENFKKARAWGIGVRRRDILWYTDIFGHDHHYGTMGLETIYMLSENGQEIRFTDSGLPCSFSKTILGPERGSFIAENMSVSGSTLFLINNAGEMYTRLIDFDTMGCDPMFFKYSYNPPEQKYSGTDYRSNYTLWGLPNEEWKKQPQIPLHGKAKLSKFISISQNGRGNSARSLKVAGLSDDGQPGFYQKQIDEENWTFVRAAMEIPETSYLTNVAQTGKKHEFSYKGSIYKNSKKIEGISCAIEDFTLTSEGSCNLILKDDFSGESVSILLYPLELWTFLMQKDPGFDGTPRNYFVTPSFDSATLNTENPAFTKILQEIFSGTSLNLYSFSASATTSYVHLTGRESGEYEIFLTAEPSVMAPQEFKTKFHLTAPLLENSIENQQLILDCQKKYTILDAPQISRVIMGNKKQIEQLSADVKDLKGYSSNSTKARWGYSLVELITTITFLNKIDFPKIKTVTMYGSDIMKTNAATFRSMAEYRTFIYPFAVSLLEKRIEVYQNFLKELSETPKSLPNQMICNSFTDYFEKVGISKKTKGTSEVLLMQAALEIDENLPLYGGMQLIFSDEEQNETGYSSFSILVEFPEFIDAYFKGRKTNSLSCRAVFKKLSQNNLNNQNSNNADKKNKAEFFFEKHLKKNGKLILENDEIKILTAKGKILFVGKLKPPAE